MRDQSKYEMHRVAAPNSRKAIVSGDPTEAEEASHRSQHSLPVSQKTLEMESSRRLSDASRQSSRSLPSSFRHNDSSNSQKQVVILYSLSAFAMRNVDCLANLPAHNTADSDRLDRLFGHYEHKNTILHDCSKCICPWSKCKLALYSLLFIVAGRKLADPDIRHGATEWWRSGGGRGRNESVFWAHADDLHRHLLLRRHAYGM